MSQRNESTRRSLDRFFTVAEARLDRWRSRPAGQHAHGKPRLNKPQEEAERYRGIFSSAFAETAAVGEDFFAFPWPGIVEDAPGARRCR